MQELFHPVQSCVMHVHYTGYCGSRSHWNETIIARPVFLLGKKFNSHRVWQSMSFNQTSFMVNINNTT